MLFELLDQTETHRIMRRDGNIVVQTNASVAKRWLPVKEFGSDFARASRYWKKHTGRDISPSEKVTVVTGVETEPVV